MNINIDISKTEPYYCKCGCGSFIDRNVIRKLPGLLNPAEKRDIYLPISVVICEDCHEPVYGILMPDPAIYDHIKKVFETSKSRKN